MNHKIKNSGLKCYQQFKRLLQSWDSLGCSSLCVYCTWFYSVHFGFALFFPIAFINIHLRNEFNFFECSWNHGYFGSLAKKVKPYKPIGLHVNFARYPKYS